MADEPWLNIFPVFAAVVYLALAGGLLRRSSTMGGMAYDWMVAYFFGALAFFTGLAANVVGWTPASEIAVAAAGASAGLAFLGPFSGVLNRYTGGSIGAPLFRWLVGAAALGLNTFGWGALAGSSAGAGDGVAEGWVAVPVAAALAALVPVALLAARKSLGRGGQTNTMQLFLGVLLFGAGILGLALGQVLTGSALGVVGGAFMYSGAAAVVGLAPAPSGRTVAARIERTERARPETGRKVRVPKGKAMEVSAFRDDGLPPTPKE